MSGLLFLTFLLIQIDGEHFGSPLFVIMLIGLFSQYFFLCLIPISGLILILLAVFGKEKHQQLFVILGLIALYAAIGVALSEMNVFERKKSFLSLLPFIMLSIGI
ncbi:MAG TPA: hypothetical protein VNZ86_18845, partial [Bacteroidia bacterium]|nr:hypothetical protein [Bacteroidia bacterium]